ncbi:MAG: serine--tRNA ligase, partial [Bacteriovoracaceae bacterium]|nr:serine--tRNA ligase [Bacteriovoracaceae bacterium]
MLDIKFILENFAEVQKNLGQRNFDLKILDQVKSLNEERKALTTAVETAQASLNKTAKEIGMVKKQGGDATSLMEQVAQAKKALAQDAAKLEQKQNELQSLLATIPNLIAPDVPYGEDDKDNQEIARWGEPRQFDFKPLDHATLGENLGMLDFERGAKITGARFVFYRQDLARLERALVNFMLEEHAKVGYEEVIPPFIANADSLYGTGQLPKFAEDLFKVEGRPWYLVPTAEVPVTNFKRGELFAASELPYKFCAYTPCFRSEAGSYGKDTRGLIRLHQFNKVEMVNIVKAEESVAAHEAMIKEGEHI